MSQRTTIPLWGKITLGLTLLNSWVLFEETVVDRTGLSQFMPLYRVGRFCAWDVGAIVLVLLGLMLLTRRFAAHTPVDKG